MSNQLPDKVDDLVSSIDELEEVLKPLLETPLLKLTSQLSAPLDRAKLEVWLSYVLNDLVWIYLRTRGINPNSTESGETHDVVAELDRVKGYFAKIKEAEDPAKRSMVVDGKVANRFIKHALSSAISAANFEATSSAPKSTHTRFDEDSSSTHPTAPAETSTKPEPEPVIEISSDSDEAPEVGTWKAKKRAREADLANQRTSGDQEPDSDDSLGGWEETNMVPAPVEEEDVVPSGLSTRTKRPRMDPFVGYSQPSSKPSTNIEDIEQTTSSSSAPLPRPASNLRHQVEDAALLSPAPAPSPVPSSSTSRGRRGKKGGSRHNKQRKMSEHKPKAV